MNSTELTLKDFEGWKGWDKFCARTDEKEELHQAKLKDEEINAVKEPSTKYPPYVSESRLRREGTFNLWTKRLIMKYLRKYSRGAGFTHCGGRAKNRYSDEDICKAIDEMLENEPVDENGNYKDRGITEYKFSGAFIGTLVQQ